MNFFARLLRNIRREGTLESTESWGDYTRETYTDETGQARYVVDNLDGKPRTIHSPTGRQYYANGGRLTGDE